MDYSQILNRSVNIVWQNKFLIVLGFLASLGSGSFSGSGSPGGGGGNGNGGRLSDVDGEILGLAIGLAIALICVALVIGVALWVVSTVARGGLIASVDTVESGGKSSFSQGWRAGWQKLWTLLGIGFLPAIPGVFLMIVGLIGLGTYGGMVALFGEVVTVPTGIGLGISVVALACVIIPVVLVLSILRNFAERACMLEDLGVIDSYRRGYKVLMANLGQAIILFLLQIVIFVVLGIFLFVPGIIVALCCFLWPLFFVAQGAVTAYVSSLWTLAWRTWTGEPPMVEKAPVAV